MSQNTCWLSKLRLLSLISAVALLASCRNLYRDFGDRTSDDYLIAQARYQLDAYDFDAAIQSITPVLSSQPTNVDVVYLASAAHAGKAGLRVLDLFAAIGSEGSSKGLIQLFAEHYAGADDTTVSEMEAAYSIVEAYDSNPATRGARLNFYSVFVLLSRMGAVSARYALLSDGTLNSDFNNCQESESAIGDTGIPSSAIDIVVDSIVKLPNTISYSGSTQFGSMASSVSGLLLVAPAQTCVALPGDNMCLVARSILGTGIDDSPSGIGFNVAPRVLPEPSPNICGAVAP